MRINRYITEAPESIEEDEMIKRGVLYEGQSTQDES